MTPARADTQTGQTLAGRSRSAWPVRAARMTAISGTVAMSSPDSELGSRRSASDSSHQGIASSATL